MTLEPGDAADDAIWLRSIAWQGGGFETEELEKVSPGVYRTTEPVPVYGNWKSAIRLHRGRTLQSLALYLPEDRAIPVEGVAATASFERPFADEGAVLRREAKDVDGWIWTLSSGRRRPGHVHPDGGLGGGTAPTRCSCTGPRAVETESAAPSPPAVLAGT